MDAGKKFDDTEISEIIKRALELQRRQERESEALALKEEGPSTYAEEAPQGNGYTLDELASIGGEVGLTDDIIRQAAAEVEAEKREKGNTNPFLGAPVEFLREEVLPFAATEEQLGQLLSRIGDFTDQDGSGNIIQGNMTWQIGSLAADRTGIQFRAGVYREGSSTRIRVQARLGQMAWGIFGGLVGGIGIGVGLPVGLGVGLEGIGSPLFATLFPLGSLIGSYLLARGIYTTVAKKWKRKCGRLVAGFTSLLRRLSGEERETLHRNG
jgi:hypothetical protein